MYISKRQTGSALIISMLLLVALAIVGLNAASSSALQERNAGNERDRALAFTAAESALRNAEDYLLAQRDALPVFDPAVTPGHFLMNDIAGLASAVPSAKLPSGAITDTTSEDLWATPEAIRYIELNGIEYGALTPLKPPQSIEGITKKPRFILEEMNDISSAAHPVRITAVGWGRNGAVVVLQSYATPPTSLPP